MKLYLLLTTLFIILFTTSAKAEENPMPFGLELGKTSITSAKAQLAGKTTLLDGGVNQYSGGTVLVSDGQGLGFEGLKQATFTFDKNGILIAVVLILPKTGMQHEGFNKILGMLKGKYKLVQKEVPFVGDAYAKFTQGNCSIELSEPHMSFDISLMYITNEMKRAIYQKSQQESSAKTKAQANSL